MNRILRAKRALYLARKILNKLEDRNFVGKNVCDSYFKTCRNRVEFLLSVSERLEKNLFFHIYYSFVKFLKK